MTSWIGDAAQMMPLACASSLSRQGGMPALTQSTWADGTTQSHVGPVTPRSWSISSDATSPAVRTVLELLAAGAVSADPLAFYSDEAVVSNVLTPEDSTLLDWRTPGFRRFGWGSGRPGGLMLDGTFVPSLASPSSSPAQVTPTRYPIPRGVTLTAAMYCGGLNASLTVQWQTSGGTALSEVSSPTSTVAGQRVSVTATAPSGAAAFTLAASGAGVGLFTVTFTPVLMPAQIGSGCLAARVVERSVDVLTAWQTPGASSSLANLQFVIREERV